MNRNAEVIRSFLAIYPDAEAREAMARVIDCLRGRNPTIRWERPPQVHITAKFLGDIPRAVVRPLQSGLEERLTGLAPITGEINLTGAFPNLRRPRIMWLGFRAAPPALHTVREACEELCAAEGLERDPKSFTPHFTIGRVKDASDTRHLEEEIAACSFPPIRVEFGALCIMKSTLAPGGAVHEVLARIPFSGAAV
jgi:RNA 2',3'-cyclic 3'-phosphodiesterase